MNFSPTIWKVVSSLIVGCVAGVLSLQPLSVKPTGGLLENGAIGQPLVAYDWSTVIVPGIIALTLAYTIWSLFQKRKIS